MGGQLLDGGGRGRRIWKSGNDVKVRGKAVDNKQHTVDAANAGSAASQRRPRTQDSAEQLTANDQAPGRRFCALLEAPANPLPSKAPPPPLGAIRLLARVANGWTGRSAMKLMDDGWWMGGWVDGWMDGDGRLPLPRRVDPVSRILSLAVCSRFWGFSAQVVWVFHPPFPPHLLLVS